MTDLTDEAVKALLDGATPGPWGWNDSRQLYGFAGEIIIDYASYEGMWFASYGHPEKVAANSAIMAAAPDLARALLEARAENARLRADAQAAVAVVVERAAEEVDRHYAAGDMGNPGHWVRALADADGLAMVEALRKERDDADHRAGAMLARVTALDADAEAARARVRNLTADLAAARAQIEALRDFLNEFASAKIDALRHQPAYGESPEDEPDPVVEADTVWAWQADAKAALAVTQEPVATLQRMHTDRCRELVAAQAQIEAMRGALQPFANIIKQMSNNHFNVEDDDLLKVSGKDLLRAYTALAALPVPNFSAGWPLEEGDGSIIVGATKPAKEGG